MGKENEDEVDGMDKEGKEYILNSTSPAKGI